jgi:predicted AAA+ superfamily ATPase
MYQRLCKLSKNNSFFLLGARGTGKSTLLKQLFPNENAGHTYFDLLDPEIDDLVHHNPKYIEERLAATKSSWAIIDEIQKRPELLDSVHRWIEKGIANFALTGSSARKLKRGQANLLAGRAFVYHLFPLTFLELGNQFKLIEVLSWGSLPKLFSLPVEDKKKFLKAYVLTYIKEEILVEQLVRKIDPFRKFLDVAAQCNGEIVNFSKIGREANIDSKSVERYFQILNDTLISFFLDAHSESVRKKQIQSPKFYFFDLGVVRALTQSLSVELRPQSYAYGKSFEHLVILEIYRLNSYLDSDFTLSYLKTKDGVEIDLVISRPGRPKVLVEIKSASKVNEDSYRALHSFKNDFKSGVFCILCLEPSERVVEMDDGFKIHVYPWQSGIKFIFDL